MNLDGKSRDHIGMAQAAIAMPVFPCRTGK
jgi:hypothetical protein